MNAGQDAVVCVPAGCRQPRVIFISRRFIKLVEERNSRRRSIFRHLLAQELSPIRPEAAMAAAPMMRGHATRAHDGTAELEFHIRLRRHFIGSATSFHDTRCDAPSRQDSSLIYARHFNSGRIEY